MVRQQLFDYIEERLNFLSCRVTSRAELNIYDLNIHCENFYMHLLNLLYGWRLTNANIAQRNAPAIDLIDEPNKIIVQVSSTCSVFKIQSSLDKLKTQYKGYHFKFISIARPADKIRDHQYCLPPGLDIVFRPTLDIIDIDSMLKTIILLSEPEMKGVYDFIYRELRFDTEQQKRESGIADVINALSDIDLQHCMDIYFDKELFNIDKKIIKNNLFEFSDLIDDYKVYHTTIQKIYDNYDSMANNKSFAVLRRIRKSYLDLKSKFKSDDLYKAIAKQIKSVLFESSNLKQYNEDDLDLYIDIVLVDAFIRCEIFEKP